MLHNPSSVLVRSAGVVCPAGSSVQSAWDYVSSGGLPFVQLAPPLSPRPMPAALAQFDVSGHFAAHEVRRLDRSHQMALIAVRQACLGLEGMAPERCGLVVGVGFGSPEYIENQLSAFQRSSARSISPAAIPVAMPNSVAATVALELDIRGPVLTIAGACAAGAHAIAEGLWLIRTGRADRVIVGGVDAPITRGMLAMFDRLEAMSRSDSPNSACRPFDRDRDGFVISEGAAFLVLDRHDTDGPKPLGEILGCAVTNDAYHLVRPDPSGAGVRVAMYGALADAKLVAADICHVNAHGTGTPQNDLVEGLAIQDLFGSKMPVVSTKATTGHMLAASGAFEAIAALVGSRQCIAHPTANHIRIDERLDIAVSDRACQIAAGPAISNSFAFGGVNVCLVVTGHGHS